jgi:isopropylmalate/homocitrate/citramalate synthase
LKYEKLYDLAHLVQELSGHAVPSNKPVVGDALFQIESGIIASWFQNCGDEYTTELFPYRAEVVGQPSPRVVLGKGSGIDSVKTALKNLGVEATEQEAMTVVAAVKEFSLSHKRLLTEAEFQDVVRQALPNKAPKGVRTAV